MDMIIRSERPEDFRAVEEVTRDAFWNLYVPGCDEHYLAHIMRGHPDFIAPLDFVAELDGRVVGNIMGTDSRLTDEAGNVLETITFGPVSVLPTLQRRGIGSALIRQFLNTARELGHKAVIIHGHPYNYCKHGFVGSKSLRISDADGRYPFSLLAIELQQGCLGDRDYKVTFSPVYEINPGAAAEFDRTFPQRAREFRPSQEEFRIASNAYLL